ncbi:FAD-dependent monooxygenase [Qaidamihabitans albus]|uniref:FAD-dependent monooxygenase n=1 Tax=Qaidamihabitans albus TaxID=2795733 RepID=UPI0018F175EE|nr:FAD-dependent monooxygenase [Qaidamihabitans albus]
MTRKAAIVGGGIGGLAAAIHLRDHGWEAEIFERAAGLPATGTALGMWPGALAALDTLGVGAAVRDRGRGQTGGTFRRPDGTPIASIDVAALQRRTGDALYLVSRPLLLGLLAERLGPEPPRFGSAVSDIRALEGYDVVVAADGGNSRARATLFGAGYDMWPAGVTAWRGTVDGDTGTVTETWGRDALFGITPQESGRTNWYACVRESFGGARAGEDDVALLRGRFGHWHGEVRGVLDRIDGRALLRHDLGYLRRPLPSYVRGNVALIGDAAHAMLPNLGRGACEALVDGVTLAGLLAESSTVDEGLARYDAARRGPTRRLARASRLLWRMTFARRFTGLRDAAVRLAVAAGPRG